MLLVVVLAVQGEDPVKVYAHLYAYPPLRLLGGELMTSVLLSALAERGHEVKVATIMPCEPYTRGGVRVSPHMVDLLSSQETAPDVFVTHPELAETNYWRAAGYGARMVAVVHNLEERTVKGLSEYAWAAIIANGYETQAELARLGFPSVVVRPPTRDLAPPRAALPRRFVTLVNLSERKGGKLFWQLAERLPDHDFLGILGGYGGQVIREGHDNVVLTSSTDNMAFMYAMTRVLIMPSERETWGMAGCEALAQGIPVLSADLPGPREAFGDAAVYLDRDDVDAWEAAIRVLDDPTAYEVAGLEALVRGGELLEMTDVDLREWCRLIESL